MQNEPPVELVEIAARIIDPSSWAVMDSYLAETKRKYRGQNVGWPADQFHHKESMAKARAVLAAVTPHIEARVEGYAQALEGAKEMQEVVAKIVHSSGHEGLAVEIRALDPTQIAGDGK